MAEWVKNGTANPLAALVGTPTVGERRTEFDRLVVRYHKQHTILRIA